MAAKHDKLVGAKFQAVKSLLDLPEACKEQILATVSLYGWEGYLKEPIVYFLCLINFTILQLSNQDMIQLLWNDSAIATFEMRMSLYRWCAQLQEDPPQLQPQGSQNSKIITLAEPPQELRGFLFASLPNDWLPMEIPPGQVGFPQV